jgi:effector-binding domain-containing protein
MAVLESDLLGSAAMSLGFFVTSRHLPVAGLAIFLSTASAILLRPGSAPGQEIGEMILQTIQARHYVYGTIETDFKSMGQPIVKTLSALIKEAQENKVVLTGPVLDIYYGVPHQDPTKKFKMETGFLLQEPRKSVGDFKVRELPEFHCATILYVGPAPRIGEAWQKLHRSIQARGLTPTDDERELYLYWEGVESRNNIAQVQVGIKGPQGKASRP